MTSRAEAHPLLDTAREAVTRQILSDEYYVISGVREGVCIISLSHTSLWYANHLTPGAVLAMSVGGGPAAAALATLLAGPCDDGVLELLLGVVAIEAVPAAQARSSLSTSTPLCARRVSQRWSRSTKASDCGCCCVFFRRGFGGTKGITVHSAWARTQLMQGFCWSQRTLRC